MLISILRIFAICIACTHMPSIVMSQTSVCKMALETDQVFGELVIEQRKFIPEANGLAVCSFGAMPESIFFVTKISTVKSIKTYQIHVPSIYSNRIPVSAKLHEFATDPLLDEIGEYETTMVCFDEDQCASYFDTGFAVVSWDIGREDYLKLIELWRSNIIVDALDSFLREKAINERELLSSFRDRDGIHIEGVTGGYSKGKLIGYGLSIYIADESGEVASWQVAIDANLDKPLVVSAYIESDY